MNPTKRGLFVGFSLIKDLLDLSLVLFCDIAVEPFSEICFLKFVPNPTWRELLCLNKTSLKWKEP